MKKQNSQQEFNDEQLKQINVGKKKGVDVSLYARPEFNARKMKELRKWLENGYDVTEPIQKNIPVHKMQIIRLSNKLSKEERDSEEQNRDSTIEQNNKQCNEYDQEIKNKIFDFIEENRIKISQLTERCGFENNYIFTIKNSTRTFPLNRLFLISKKLGIKLSTLFPPLKKDSFVLLKENQNKNILFNSSVLDKKFCGKHSVCLKKINNNCFVSSRWKGKRVWDYAIALYINRFRINAKIGIDKLAKRLDLSPSLISCWETGKRKIEILYLPLISAVFGVTIDKLIPDIPFALAKQRIKKGMFISLPEPSLPPKETIPTPDFDKNIEEGLTLKRLFQKNIKELRIKNNISEGKIAKLFKTTDYRWKKFEKGTLEMNSLKTLTYLPLLAKALKTTIPELFSLQKQKD